MKRKDNLFDQLISTENIIAADKKARIGKNHRKDVKLFDQDKAQNINAIQSMLANQTYRVSPYRIFPVFEPKKRDVYQLPYRDHLIQHVIMNVMDGMFTGMLTADTYSCIKGRGIHGALRAVNKALRNERSTRYCLKLDVRKFYPTIDHGIIKQQLRRKLKDERVLRLFDVIIDSADGLPIGNYLSLPLANFHLTPFDHWIKETLRVKDYFRYLDDMVILSGSKEHLHIILAEIRKYLKDNLNLDVKNNYQIFPVESRGIDFVGYVIRHKYVLLRKTTKKNFARKVAKGASPHVVAAYKGWTDHADCKNLVKKLLNEEFQRPRNNSRRKRVRGGQDRRAQHPERTNQSVGFRHQAIQVLGERNW